jgi:ribosome-binding factor A
MSRKSKASTKPPTKRQLRVGEEIRHSLAGIFIRQDTYVEELRGISITVSEVSVSPDLSNARVFVMPLGGEDIETILPALNKMAPFFAHHVSQKVHLRRMPKLKFLVDGSFDHVDRITSLFNKLPEPENEDNSISTDTEMQINPQAYSSSQIPES